MRIKVRRIGVYEAAHSMTLALVTLYAAPDADIITEYKQQSRRPSAFMAECAATLPTPENAIQAALRECCPVSKRVKLYIKKWALDRPSHYVILHRTPDDTFKLGCNRLLSCTAKDLDSLIDGVLMTWPNADPSVGCGQTATIQRIFASGISAPTEILTLPELRRELMLAIEVARLYQSSDVFTVWTHPGKAVFQLIDSNLVLMKTRPYATPPTKPNVVIYGDVTNNVMGAATELPRHIVPQIKGAVPMDSDDPVLVRLLKWALEARLLPYLAVATTQTRGNVYALSYDPEADDYCVAEIGTNKKIVGMPQVLRIDNGGAMFVPDLDLAVQLKAMFFAPDVKLHIEALKGLLREMGYKSMDKIAKAFRNWDLPMNAEEEEKFEIVRSGL